MSQRESLGEWVSRVHHQLFTEHDTRVLERDFAADFIEHSPLIANGLSGLQELVQNSPQLHYECHRVLEDGDLVALHGRFVGLDKQPLVGFDLYRVRDGKIVEHWDGLVPECAANASGRTQLDGPVEPGEGHDREQNRRLIREFFTRTLIGSDYSGFRHYTDGTHFIQHNPDIADGVEEVIAVLDTLIEQGQKLEYERIHRMVAQGQFVLTFSEGRIAGERHAYFELWRLSEGRLVEMWDAIAAIPEDSEARHRHGLF
ncbi:MAG: nuclear transport factor 2 family protein [Enterobacteriaceae bacterium]